MKRPGAGRWLVVLVLAVAPAVAPALEDGAAAPMRAPGSRPAAGTEADSASLSDLPLPAQAQISAVVGRDRPRYHAAAQAGGFCLHNPGLTADFTRAGLRVQAGTARFGLSLVGYGYGYGDEPPAPIELTCLFISPGLRMV